MGPIAPCLMDLDVSTMNKSGSIDFTTPNPLHFSHAPTCELNENIFGVNFSGSSIPQSKHNLFVLRDNDSPLTAIFTTPFPL